mmetsp:Transcript_22574/g.49456  ORF Transcript_22574/g.49456 Transcript_22574/m.49456 type:complete len:234 (-) Transcript_22574:651-1352(-)
MNLPMTTVCSRRVSCSIADIPPSARLSCDPALRASTSGRVDAWLAFICCNRENIVSAGWWSACAALMARPRLLSPTPWSPVRIWGETSASWGHSGGGDSPVATCCGTPVSRLLVILSAALGPRRERILCRARFRSASAASADTLASCRARLSRMLLTNCSVCLRICCCSAWSIFSVSVVSEAESCRLRRLCRRPEISARSDSRRLCAVRWFAMLVLVADVILRVRSGCSRSPL